MKPRINNASTSDLWQLRYEPPRNTSCNCEGGAGSCPVQGAYKQEGVVYEACVRERNSGKTETYTGFTGRSFKQRWKEHQRDFDNPDKRNETRLSLHIWELKDRGVAHDTSWRLLDRATTYNPATKKCNLCIREKYFIMYQNKSSTLNKRSEVYNTTHADIEHRAYWRKSSETFYYVMKLRDIEIQM